MQVASPEQHAARSEGKIPPVEMVRPGIWSIPTPFPGSLLRYVLSYAIEYDGGVALVDTGWPCDLAWDGLVAGLDQAGWTIADVKGVLVTHRHADHLGLARRIREVSGAWLGMHPADADIDGRREWDDADHLAKMRTWLKKRGVADAEVPSLLVLPSEMDDEGFWSTPDRLVEDGDTPLGPGSGLTAVWTPGHTPGHLCFHDRDRGLLLAGDHLLPRITPNISPGPTNDADVLGQYLDSLTRLAELPVEEVLPAHEYRFTGLNARVEELLEHHRARLDEVLEVVTTVPGATTIEVAAHLTWSRPWGETKGLFRRSAVGEVYAHLVYLEGIGQVANKDGRGMSAIDAWVPQPGAMAANR